MNPHPHVSLVKFFVYVLVALVFFVGGYFIGKGFIMEDQSASVLTGVKKIPCGDRIPCPSGDDAPMMAANSGVTVPTLILRNWCIRHGGTYSETQTGLWGAGDITRTCTGAHGPMMPGGVADVVFADLSSPAVLKAIQSSN